MHEGNGSLSERLPMPLAECWEEVLAAGDAPAPALLLAARRTARDVLRDVREAAVRRPGEHEGDPVRDAVARILATDVGGVAAASFLGLDEGAGAAAAEEAPSRVRARLERALEAVAASGLAFHAVLGQWTVRLHGADSGDGADGSGHGHAFVTAGAGRVPLSPRWSYDPEEDRLVRSSEALDAAAPAGPAPPGDEGAIGRIGPYRLLRRLSQGGQGILYEAREDSPPRRVALKTLPAATGADARARRRMADEGAALARIEHPHIVPVYATGEWQGVPWIAMRYVDGEDLASALERHRREGRGIPWRQAATWARDLARALDACHERGVIHRDVKPANVMLDAEGRPLLTDFGLASLLSAHTRTTAAAVVGTLHYLAPELLSREGRRPDPRVDIYGLGATLYEMLALRRPFAADAGRSDALLRAVCFEEPLPVRRQARRIPRDLATIVGKAMAKEPERRYATALDLAEDLDRLLAGEPVRARRPGRPERLARWGRRHPAAAVAAVAALLLGITAGGLLVRQKVVRQEAELRGIHAERVETERRRVTRAREILDESHTDPTTWWRRRDDWVLDLVRLAGPETVAAVVGRLDRITDRLRRGDELAEEDESELYVCLEALGKMGVPELSGPALGRYLAAEPVEDRALRAGEALVRLHRAGASVSAYAEPALERFGAESRFYRAAGLYLAVGAPGGALPVPSALPPERRRTHHGGLAFEGYRLLDPAFVESRLRLRMPMDGRRETDDEVVRWTRLLRMDPRDSGALERRAASLANLNRLEEAFWDITRAVELTGGDPRRLAERAHLRRMNGDLEGARRDLEAALAKAPDAPEHYRDLVILLADLGRADEAVAAADRALELFRGKPPEAVTLLYAAMARLVAGQDAAAARDAEAVVAARPSMAEAWHTLGVSRLLGGDAAGAVAAGAEAIALEPGYILAWHGRGTARLVAGDRAGAIADFSRAIDMDPHLPFSWLNRGVARAVAGETDAARADLEEAVRRCPDLAHAWLALGTLRAAAGNPERARSALRAARDLAPAEDPVSRRAAEVLDSLP